MATDFTVKSEFDPQKLPGALSSLSKLAKGAPDDEVWVSVPVKSLKLVLAAAAAFLSRQDRL